MSDEAAPRRFTARGQATRDRIVEAATRLIAEHGVAGTNTEQVRAAAGVSGSQLYHYFDSKQALIRAVITRQADAVGGVPDLGPLDSFDALQAWADAAVARGEENGGRGDCTLNTLAGQLATGDAAAREDLTAGFLRWKGVLLEGLTRMRARGELRPDADLDDLAYALLAGLQGGVNLSRTLGDVTPFRVSMTAALAYVRSFSPSA
ncbi:TetR/AcrR family transcriptional regulator [Jatrophihabitans sp. YIM 134969]